MDLGKISFHSNLNKHDLRERERESETRHLHHVAYKCCRYVYDFKFLSGLYKFTSSYEEMQTRNVSEVLRNLCLNETTETSSALENIFSLPAAFG